MIYNLKNRFLYFSFASFVFAIIFFTAYNWKGMGNFEKLSVPSFLVLIGVLGWYVFKREVYKNLSLLFSSFMVGVLFAVFGQVYQTGADAYSLFLNWGIFTLLFGVSSGFYPIWFLNSAVFSAAVFLYSNLHYNFSVSSACTSFFVFLLIFIYLSVLKIKKIKINKIFFYFLAVGFIFLLTMSVVFSSAFLGTENLLNDLYYIVSLGIFTYIFEKKIKRSGVLPLSIISLEFFIETKLGNFNLGGIIHYSLSVLTILAAIKILLRLTSANKKLKKIIKIIVNILKFNLAFIVLFLTETFILLLGFEEHSLGGAGIALLILSQYLPKFLKFKNDKTEIVTFICGIVLLGVYVDDVIYNFSDFIIVLGITAVFDIFYKIRHSKSMEYLLIPIHSVAVATFFIDYEIFDVEKVLVGGSVLLIVLLGILEYIFKEKNNLKSIVRGLEIFIIIGAVINRTALLVGIWQFKPIHTYVGITASIVSIFILALNKNKLDKISLAVLAATVLGVGYFCINFPNISIMLMFIILYAVRKEKYYEIVSSVFLILEISQYYYFTHMTLMEKSLSLFKMGILLLICYIILNKSEKIKQVKNYEK